MFITAVCVLFSIKLRWPKNKSLNIIKLPVLNLTNQNKRHYHFRFESVNQLVAFLTSVAPNCQRHSAKAGSLKQRQNIADLLAVWPNELAYI